MWLCLEDTKSNNESATICCLISEKKRIQKPAMFHFTSFINVPKVSSWVVSIKNGLNFFHHPLVWARHIIHLNWVLERHYKCQQQAVGKKNVTFHGLEDIKQSTILRKGENFLRHGIWGKGRAFSQWKFYEAKYVRNLYSELFNLVRIRHLNI